MKKQLIYASRVVLGVLSCYPLVVSAENLVVESYSGETYVLEIDSTDSFLDVIESVKVLTNETVFENDGLELVNISPFTVKMVNLHLAKKVSPDLRKYEAGLSQSDTADITYIIKTLANSSLPKIKAAESSLKKAGDRIEHVHPFNFLTCIFTNEELKVCIRNLQGRAFVWKNFLNGTLESLTEESARDNLSLYINDFAAKIKVDPNAIAPIIQSGKWERLVNTLIDLVPREGGVDRYNM